MAVSLEAYPMFDSPEWEARRIMPAASAVLLSAAFGGLWLAWRARREDTPP